MRERIVHSSKLKTEELRVTKERQSMQGVRGCGFLTFGIWPALACKPAAPSIFRIWDAIYEKWYYYENPKYFVWTLCRNSIFGTDLRRLAAEKIFRISIRYPS